MNVDRLIDWKMPRCTRRLPKNGVLEWPRKRTKISVLKLFCKEEAELFQRCCKQHRLVHYSLFFFFLSPCPVQGYGSNLITFYAKQICFAEGSFINVKLLLMPINCPFIYFCLQYITCNRAEPDRGTRKEEEQRRGNRTKIENWHEKSLNDMNLE